MNKDTSSGRVSPRLLLAIFAAFCITLVGLAFTISPASETKIASEGRQEVSSPASAVSVFYNNTVLSQLHFLSTAPALTDSSTDATDASFAWQTVSVLPGPTADGSNQLKLYDAGSPLLPEGLLPHKAGKKGTGRVLSLFWACPKGKRQENATMPHKLRIQHPGTMYHVIHRGNYRNDIFGEEGSAQAFMNTLYVR
jgi:hypothetical protein